jgi:hypothetical protein
MAHLVLGGYTYGDLALQIRGVSDVRRQILVVIPVGPRLENECSG